MKLISTFILLLLLVSCNMPDPSAQQVEFVEDTKSDLVMPQNGVYDVGFHELSQSYRFRIQISNPGKLPALDISFNEAQLIGSAFRFGGPEPAYPGEDGTCTNELASGASCELDFIFIGNQIQTYDKTVIISFNNGLGEIIEKPIILKGRAGYPAELEVTDVYQNQHYFGEIEPSVSATHTFKILNSGDMEARNIDVIFSTENEADRGVFDYAGGSFPGTNGTCTRTLGAREECLLDLSATPIRNEEEVFGKFSVYYDNPVQTTSFDFDLRVKARELSAKLNASVSRDTLPITVNNPEVADRPTFTITLTNVGFNKATDIQVNSLSELDGHLVENSNTCAGDLLIGEFCQIVYAFAPNYPIASTSFPKKEEFVDITFSYDNQRGEILITNPIKMNTETQLEGHLLFFADAETTNLMPNDESAIDFVNSTSFERKDTTAYVGDTATVHRFAIYNGRFPRERKEVTDITFEITPNNGYLKLTCLEIGNCPQGLASAMSSVLYLEYTAKDDEPYNTEQDYQLKVTYHNGKKTKSYTIDIPTKDVPVPFLKVKVENLDEVTHNLPSLAGQNHVRSSVITMTNDGATAIEANYTIVTPNANFVIPPEKDNCTGQSIGRYESCTFQVDFIKNTKDTAFGIDDEQTLKFTTHNGLPESADRYQLIEFEVFRRVVDPTVLAYTGDPLHFDVEELSLPSAGGYEPFQLQFSNVLIDRNGSWDLTSFSWELVGPDKDFFRVEGFEINELTNQPSPLFNVFYTVPETAVSKSAELKIYYHGNGEAALDPKSELTIPLSAGPGDLNPYIVIEKLTPNGSDYHAAAFSPQTKGVPAATQTIRVRNDGYVNLNSFGEQIELYIHDKSLQFTLGNRLASSSPSCVVYSSPDEFTKYIDIGPNGDFCDFELNFTPPDDGPHQTLVRALYKNSRGTARLNDIDCGGVQQCSTLGGATIWGSGIPWANFEFSPNKTGGLMYVSFGDPELDDVITKTITVSSTVQNSRTGEFVVAPTEESWGVDDCVNDQVVPSRWQSFSRVDGKDIDFVVSNLTCSPGQQLNYGDSCSFDVTFTPRVVDQLSGMCLYMTYKRFEEDTEYETKRVTLISNSEPPDAVFNGWREILAEGQSTNSNQFVNLKWRPMSSAAPTKTNLIGYHVYRKERLGAYPDHPLTTELIDPTPISDVMEYIEFTDNQINETDPDYPLLEAGKVYDYMIQGIYTIVDNGTREFELKAKEGDQQIRVIMPGDNMSLMHRLTVNTRTCLEELGKTPGELYRFVHNSCDHAGIGTNGGRFDIEDDIIIDKFETIYHNLALTNQGGGLPHLFDDPDDAIDYCESRETNYSDLNQNGIKNALIDRTIFMLASAEMRQVHRCNTDSYSLNVTDRSGDECKSKYGLQDLLGNAWEWTTNYMAFDDFDNPSWNYENFNLSSSAKIPYFNLTVMDPDDPNLDWDVIPTWGDRFEFHNGQTPCISPIVGLPFNDIATVCPTGTIPFNEYKDKMDVLENQDYIHINQMVFDGLVEEFEADRRLMVGGAFSSKRRLDIPSSRWAMYWGLPGFEDIFQDSMDEPYTGGAARCYHRVGY